MLNITTKQIMAGVILMSAQSSVLLAAEIGADVFATDQSMSVTAPSQNGLTVIDGDILTGPKMMKRGSGGHLVSPVWEDGIVPFYIDPELQNYVEVIIKSAVNTWNKVAGITLVEINPRDWDAPEDYLHFMPAAGCASWVGRQGGAQAVWAGPACSRGSMMHEIGHALGLEHEHTRPDRDQFVQINIDNIDPDKISNFNISQSNVATHRPYDYESIMHYGEYFFSSNDQPTIVPLTGEYVEIGQRVAPSAGDIASIASIYASDVSLVSDVVTIAGRSEVSIQVTNEHSQGANMLEVSMFTGTAQLVSTSNADWECFAHDALTHCNIDRLSGSSHSSLVLTFDQIVDSAELNVSLTSKTHDHNLTNNAGNKSASAASSNADFVMPLADAELQASAGATGYSLLFLALIFVVRVTRRGSVQG